MNTATALRLERLRYHSASEIQATRCDPDLTDEEKRARVAELRQAHARRARDLIERGGGSSWQTGAR